MTTGGEAQTSRRRWVMLALGTTAQAVASCLLFGLPFLLPFLRRTEGLTLAQGGALVAAPSLGMVVTLIAWGAFADRYGERLAIALGLGLTGVLGLGAAAVSGLGARGVLFALMGAAGSRLFAMAARITWAQCATATWAYGASPRTRRTASWKNEVPRRILEAQVVVRHDGVLPPSASRHRWLANGAVRRRAHYWHCGQ